MKAHSWVWILFAARTLAAQPVWTTEARPTLEITDYKDPLGRIIGAATLRNGSIVVVDESNSQVYTFGANGAPVSALGRKGSGPGEFRTMSWLGLCGSDTVAIFDQIQNRVTRLDANGKLAGVSPARVQMGFTMDRHTSPYDLACGPTGAKAIVGWPTGELPAKIGPHRSSVTIGVAKTGNVFKQLGTFPGPERYHYGGTNGPRSFGKKVVVAVSATRVYVGTADSFHVSAYDLDGVKRADIRRGFSPKPLTPADRERHVQQILQRSRYTVPEKRLRQSLGNDVLPTHLPPYERFLVDGPRLWIEEGHGPSETKRHWWGFGERGEPVGRITVPAELELYEVTGSVVIGKWTDDDGAESVRRYRLVASQR
jgi:hypothetical protein